MIDWLEQHSLPCFFKSSFGIECPGCGTQRAFIALLKGNFIESFHDHPGLIPFLMTFILALIQLRIKHPKGGLWVMWMFIFSAGITILNYVIKQL